MSSIKITGDNFVWKILQPEQAEALFKSGYPVYAIDNDESEVLISNYEQLTFSLTHHRVAIEVGFLPEEGDPTIAYYTESRFDDNSKRIKVFVIKGDRLENIIALTAVDYKPTLEVIYEELPNNTKIKELVKLSPQT